MSKSRVLGLLAAILIGATTAAAIIYAPRAWSSPESEEIEFLYDLYHFNIHPSNPNTAVAAGREICHLMDITSMTPSQTALKIYASTGPNIPTFDSAASWVAASIDAFCPWHDPRKQALA